MPADFPVAECQESGGKISRSVGCRHCRNTGYSGRVGIYELLEVNDEIRALAQERTATNLLKKAAIKTGMQTLRRDGWQKVLSGKTTVEEVLRVSKAD